jgi:RNA polymerase sigma-70 factor (ECF subfamily)
MANPFDQPLDDGIVSRARGGDMKAHAVLYRSFGPAVYSLARRLVRNPDLAEELLQDTFVEVIHSIGRFRGEAPVGAWIRRIAVSKCLMHLRSYWEKHRTALDDVAEPEEQRWATAPAVQQRLDLEIALGLLPAPARAVVWLHEVEGYTHEEIAALTGMTPSYSKSQLARAYQRLREQLGRPRGQEEDACTRPSMIS